jgi:two-component system NarL family sensor kinase
VRGRFGLDGPNGQARIAALARLALVPLLLVVEALENPASAADLPLAEPLLLFLVVVYAPGCAAYAFAARRPVRLAPFAVADVLILSVFVYLEGGAAADARLALYVPVLIAAFLAGPRLTLGLAVLSVAGYGAAAVVHHARTPGDMSAEYIAIHMLDLGWRGGLAVTMSLFLTRRAERIRELADSRRSLVTQALSAEAHARRELSYVLHDELVQELLCAQQDLKVARRGRPEYIDRAEEAIAGAVGRLREQIFHLHPHQLESVGLAAALQAVAAQHAPADGSLASVEVGPGTTGDHDELLFSLGRELLTNAARHAGAATVSLTVERDADATVLSCRDDGRGFDPARRGEALRDGHLGLAACTERVEALGGRLEVDTAPGRGTVVRAWLPAERTGPEPTGAGTPAPDPAAARLATA